MADGTITIVRNSCAVAKLVKVKVKVDGREYGAIKENESLTIKLPHGMHHLEMKAAGNPSYHSTIEISEKTNGNSYSFEINMMGKPDFGGEDPGTVTQTSSNVVYEKQTPKKRGCLQAALIAVGAILAVFLVILVIVALLDGNDNKNGKSGNTTTNDPKHTLEIISEPTFASVTGEVGQWEVTVNDFNYKDSVSIGFLHEYRAEENGTYCVISVTVKNIGSQSGTFLPMFAIGNATTAKIKWADYEYTRSELLLSEDNLSSETLNPLVSTSGDLAFEVPAEMAESDEAPVLVFSAGKSSFSCELVKTVPEG